MELPKISCKQVEGRWMVDAGDLSNFMRADLTMAKEMKIVQPEVKRSLEIAFNTYIKWLDHIREQP